jgi:alpha-N-arabinofuranosidase
MTSVAQVVNVLQALILTEGASSILTPTYHVYRMYQPHQHATCVRTEAPDGPLSVSASRSGDRLYLTVVNQSLAQDHDLEVVIRGGKASQVEAANLTGDNVRTQNTREQPSAVSPRPAGVRTESSKLLLKVPAKSVQAVSAKLT